LSKQVDIQKHLATSLRKLRKQQALTQVEFSGTVGIDYRHYQEMEAGRVDPKISTINKISRTFKVSVAELLPKDA
jgi:DNA-binding XRE family transcriptional regulator